MSLSKDYDLFIFDWDGTLSTSTLLVRLSRFLKRRYNPKFIKKHKEMYEREARKPDVKSENRNKLYSILYDAYSVVVAPKLKEGSIETLKKLKSDKKRIAVFSDSQSYRLFKEMKALGVIKYFDFVLSASTVDYYKPDPRGLIFIVEKFRAKKSRSIYIGDMASDVLTAKFAGIASCGVADGLDPYEFIKEARPKFLFKSLKALSKSINRK